MDKNILNGTRRQIKQLFQGLEAADDFTAAKQLAQTSTALLRLLKKLNVDFGAVGDDDFSDMVATYMGISQSVSSFASQIRSRDAAQAERCIQAGGQISWPKCRKREGGSALKRYSWRMI